MPICDNWIIMSRKMLQHGMKCYLCTLSTSIATESEIDCEHLLWTSSGGAKCLCACVFPLSRPKMIQSQAVLQNTTNKKDIWRGWRGCLTPDVLRVASLGHQFLDVVCSLGARHAAEFLGYLVENSLYIPRHVPCISGRQKTFKSQWAVHYYQEQSNI